MTAGIYWFDAAGNQLTVEYSTEVYPTAGATWNQVDECRSMSRNPEASTEIDFTNYESTEEETRLGLPRRGSWEFGANFVPESASQEAVLGLDNTKSPRWWRITYPKATTGNSTAASEMFAGEVQVASINPPDADASEPVLFSWTVRARAGYTFTAEAA